MQGHVRIHAGQAAEGEKQGFGASMSDDKEVPGGRVEVLGCERYIQQTPVMRLINRYYEI